MRISAINVYSYAFGNKHTKKEKAKAARLAAQTAPQIEENDVYTRKLQEIKQTDPKFKPNPEVEARVKEMKKQKLSKFDNEVIKEVLSTDKQSTKRTIAGINTVEKFSADEIKLLMRDEGTRRHINYLMSGIVPKCSIENSEMLLRNALFTLKQGIEEN